jgi:uncharacterized protein
MALINKVKREINAKLVYFGPGLSGKTTNLNLIYAKLKPEFRGKLKTMSIQNDKMLFFDFTPPGDGNVSGYNVRFHVYTIKGEATGASPWKMVLKGADGVVFVADSAPERLAANQESLQNLDEYLGSSGQSLTDVPVIFEYNKRDSVNAVPLDELQSLLNPGNFPHFQATASRGEGVLNTLLAMIKMVLKKLRDSGLELVEVGEELRSSREEAAAESAQARPELEQEEYAFAAEEVVTAASLAEEGLDVEAAAETHAEPSRLADEPEVMLQGDVEMIAPGRLRLPLIIRYAGGEKRVALNLSVSLD